MTDWDHLSSREVDQVMGAFFLVRREVFDLLSGFDERFFLYFEDVDFSLRARRIGFRSYYLADAFAIHFGWGSTGSIRAKRYFFSMRSRILYAAKHFSQLGLIATLLGTLFVEPLSRILFFLSHGEAQSAGETVAGWIMLCKELPRFLRRRHGLESST
jgi:GT2 family glycosyltransferase